MIEFDAKPLYADPVSPWYPWFAWKPVQCWDGRRAWLRMIFRRRCQNKTYINGLNTLPNWW